MEHLSTHSIVASKSRPDTLHPNQLYLMLASYIIVYYLSERVLRLGFSSLCPSLHDDLLKRSKAAPFFGLGIGFIFSAISTPTCYRAFTQLPSKTSLDFAHPGLAEVCIGARSMLWLEELSRLGDETAYLLHHGGSLFMVMSILHYSFPGAKYYCAIAASLVTELGTDVTAMLAYCGFKAADHQWIWWLECLNVVGTIAVRAPAFYLACFSSWHEDLPLLQQIVWIIPAALYVAYQVYATRARVRRLIRAASAAAKAKW